MDTSAHIGIARGLSKRLFPVSLGIGALLSILFPAAYYTLESRAIKRATVIYADDIAHKLQSLLMETPSLWKYHSYKYAEIIKDFRPTREVLSVQVFDEEGEPVKGYANSSEGAQKWWNRYAQKGAAPISFNNRVVGEVEVIVAQTQLLWTTLLIFSLSTSVGIGLALLVYRFPVRVVTRMEGAIEELIATVKRSNTELEQFAYVASHDLQEPLRMITNYLQLLSRRYKEKLDTDACEFIAFAVDGAIRMQRLINDLLAYSRVGSKGKEFAPVDMEKVLQEVLAGLKVAMEESGAVVSHSPLPTLMGDDVQLGQLLQNLIVNAIKFHGEKPPKAHISAERCNSDWVFSVQDNGIGIQAEYFKRIFLIFQRLHTRADYPGTGIGLAVCKRIAERHRGRIWVESEPGCGAKFIFTIPATRRD